MSGTRPEWQSEAIERLRAELAMGNRWYKSQGEMRLALHLLRWMEGQAEGKPRTELPSSHHA